MGGTAYPPPTYDPYRMPYNGLQQPQSALNAPRYEIIRVNGKGGVDALQMAPNSSVIVMDETAPMVWLISSDGAGYKTANPFDISPHRDAPAVDTNALETRVKTIGGYFEWLSIQWRRC
jgi:hypothetical protein